jgi:hypothetical protein
VTLRLIEKLIPSSKKSRGGCRILFLHIIIPRDKHIYRARKRERERDGRNARGMRAMRGIQPPVSGVKLKNNKRKEKGISRAAHAAAPGPHCHESFRPLCPQNYPAHATHFSKLLSRRPPHLLWCCVSHLLRRAASVRKYIERWELKFIARAGGISWLSKSIKSQTEEIARWGFPFWSHVCSLFADLLSSLAAHKKCHVCARALKGEIIFHRAAI